MRARPLLLLPILLAACGKAAPPASTDGRDASAAQATAPTTSPTAISHGEAAIGSALTSPDRAADAPPPPTASYRQIRFVAAHVRHEVAPGVVYEAWTFDSMVPGPVTGVTKPS